MRWMIPVCLALTFSLAACGSCESTANGRDDADARPEGQGERPDVGLTDAVDDASDEPDAGPDLSEQPDASPDVRPEDTDMPAREPSVFLEPAWTRFIQGSLSLWGPHVEIDPDGQVIGALTYGSEAPSITFGEGEPNETTFDERFKVAVAWFDGADGTLVRARKVAEDLSMNQRSSVVAQGGIDVDSDGGIWVAGNWHGSAVFHAGTAAEIEMTGQSKLNGDRLDRAENPWVTRYDPDGTAAWVVRGRTPSPLSRTWFNDAYGLATLGKDEMAFVGYADGSGVTFGEPVADPVVLSSGSFFTRLDSDGAPGAIIRFSDARMRGVRGTPDGTAYVVTTVGANTVYDPGGAAVDVEPAESDPDGPSYRTYALARIDHDNQIPWVQRFVLETYGAMSGFEAMDDGSVIATGVCEGLLELRATDDTVAASEMCGEHRAWIARFAPDGSVDWLQLLDEPVRFLRRPRIAEDGTSWLVGRVDATAAELELGETGTVDLPDVDATESEYFDVVISVDPDGVPKTAHVIGRNLTIDDMAIGHGRLAITAIRHHIDEDDEMRFEALATETGLEMLAPVPPDLDSQAIYATFEIQ